MDNTTPSPDNTTPPATPVPRSSRPLHAALAGLLVLVAVFLAYRTYSPAWSARPAEPVPPARQIDLNAADRTELLQVPGIGPQLADNILAHRRDHGRFEQLEDLQTVRGVGGKTFDKLRPWLRVNTTDTSEPVERLERKPRPVSTSAGMSNTSASSTANRIPKMKPGDPPLDLNSASEEELLRLPGVGTVLAAKIIASRGEGFNTIDDLKRVRGVGNKTMEAVRPYIRVTPKTSTTN